MESGGFVAANATQDGGAVEFWKKKDTPCEHELVLLLLLLFIEESGALSLSSRCVMERKLMLLRNCT